MARPAPGAWPGKKDTSGPGHFVTCQPCGIPAALQRVGVRSEAEPGPQTLSVAVGEGRELGGGSSDLRLSGLLLVVSFCFVLLSKIGFTGVVCGHYWERGGDSSLESF